MSKYIFLYREKDSDDRDCCAYIEPQPRFECSHYFGSIILHGACYCKHDFAPYEDVETILAKNEYQALIDFNKAIDELGYGIKEGDDRFKRGMALCADIAPIIAKLESDEGKAFAEKIFESEAEYLMNEFNLDEDDVEYIFDNYGLDYRDRGVVGGIYSDTEDLGYEEAWSLGYISGKGDSIMDRYFDYAKFGEDLVNDDECYLELRDGRCVRIEY